MTRWLVRPFSYHGVPHLLPLGALAQGNRAICGVRIPFDALRVLCKKIPGNLCRSCRRKR